MRNIWQTYGRSGANESDSAERCTRAPSVCGDFGCNDIRLVRFQGAALCALAVTLVVICFGMVSLVQAVEERPFFNQSGDATGTIVLENATIISMTSEGTFQGTIVIRDAKIAQVIRHDENQASGSKSPDSQIYDLTGYTVTPGLIDCRSVLWLESGAMSEASSTAALDIVNGIDPWQEDWREVSAQGITTVGVQPSGTLGGYAAALSVLPSHSRDEIVLKNEIAVSASIGINGNTSVARFTEFNRIRNAIKKIVDGQAVEEEEEKQQDEEGEEAEETPQETPAGQAAARPTGAASNRVTPPDRTADLLKRVVNGELALRVRCRHSDVINWMLELGDEFGIRIIFEEIPQAARFSTKIHQQNVPVIVGPFGSLSKSGGSDLDKDFSQDWIADHAAEGGLWSVASFSNQPRGSRLLRFNVASLLAQVDVSRDDALQAITLNAAKILGVADQVGSIAVGKRADLAVFAGDPLDPSVPVRLVLCNGRVVHESAFEPEIVSRPTIEESSPFETFGAIPAHYAIKSNQVLQGGKFAPGMLVVKDGMIESIDVEVKVDGIPLYEMLDAIITPGLVVAHSNLGHQSLMRDNPESDATLFRAVDVFESGQKQVAEMLSGGFIHIGLAPESNRTSAGCVGQIRLSAASSIVLDHMASQFVLASSARDAQRFPVSLTGQAEMLDQLLAARIPESRLFVSSAIARSLNSEKFNIVDRVKGGAAKSLFHVDNHVETRFATRLAQQYQLAGAILTDTVPSESLSGLLKSKLGLIVLSATGTEYDRHFDDIAAAVKAGVPLAFSGDDPERIRGTAAILATAGVSRESLLHGLTGGAAEMVGMTDKTGQLVSGAPADFVIWNGSPLDLSSKPLAVFVDGKLTQ